MKTVTIIKRVMNSEAGRRTPVAVLARLLAWQLWRRVVRRPLTFTTVTGAKLRLVLGASDSLSGFWYQQLPDFEEMCFALHLVRPGELFVDIGANQGGWTLTVAGGGARVMAFEPVPLTRGRLGANVAANPSAIRERIRVLPVGLGERAGEVRFTADLDSGNHQLTPKAAAQGEGIPVTLATLDEVLGQENPVLIKIDVEGGELAVLKGAAETLKKPSLLALIVETFRPHNFAESNLKTIEQLLTENGFLSHAYDPWLRRLSPLLSPSAGGQNTIYVRPGAEVNGRVATAEPIRVLGRKI